MEIFLWVTAGMLVVNWVYVLTEFALLNQEVEEIRETLILVSIADGMATTVLSSHQKSLDALEKTVNNKHQAAKRKAK